jgi:rhombotail lipoprotein
MAGCAAMAAMEVKKMIIRVMAIVTAATLLLSGCVAFDRALCYPACRSESRASSSLVGFLYPNGQLPPSENAIPRLNLPLRVGLAFLPSQRGGFAEGLEAAHRDELLERIRQRFADRKFVSEIVLIPDYYLKGGAGFDGLAGAQRLYNVDLMALVSYDQVMYRDENAWSLGYLTIVGAYVLPGNRHDVTTLMDLAVIDPASKSIVLRAGGSDSRHDKTTLINDEQQSREARTKSFASATDVLIGHFDAALTNFEADVRSGKANVVVNNRASNGRAGGVGALDPLALLLLGMLLVARRRHTLPRHGGFEGRRARALPSLLLNARA